MGFRTKLDFSDNRQVKQRIETTTVLSGATSFGVPYDQLPTGPNYALSAITLTIPPSSATTGTFSGNNTTTVFTWPINDLYLADSTFSAITPSNSASSQTSDFVFTADTNTMFTVDGNVGYGSYTGVGFSMFATSMVDLGGGSYSGTVNFTDVNYVQAPGLDFSGRTIWNDVSGITRTDRLIISDDANIGRVFMCNSSEGMGKWETLSGLTATTALWTNDGVGGGGIRSTNGVTHVMTGNTDYSMIAGGIVNKIYTTINGFIGGGSGNIIDNSDNSGIISSDDVAITNSPLSNIIGGQSNYITDSSFSNISNGSGHNIEDGSTYASIFNGRFATIKNSDWSTLVNANSSLISGGTFNGIYSSSGCEITGSTYSNIYGGAFNAIHGGVYNSFNSIYGGSYNTIENHSNSFIIGGSGNTIHFDLDDLAIGNANGLEAIINSRGSSISASTNSVIHNSLNVDMTLTLMSEIRNSSSTGIGVDTEITGFDYGVGTINGFNLIDTAIDSRITGVTTFNTILGSRGVKIDGPYSGSSSYNNSVIGSNNIFLDSSDGYGNYNCGSYNNDNLQLRKTAFGLFGGNISAISYSAAVVSMIGTRASTITNAQYSSIFGGRENELYDSMYSTILGGRANGIYTTSTSYGWGTLIGGQNNTVNGDSNYFAIIGGGNSTINDSNAAILVSEASTITGSLDYSAILVGTNNTMTTSIYTGPANTIMAGGNNNLYRNSGFFGLNNSVMLGGQEMTINGASNMNNMITSYQSAMSGTVSLNSIISSDNCKINTGTESGLIFSEQSNLRNVYQSFMVGSSQSTISGTSTVTSAFILGGEKHSISGASNTADYSTIINGSTNTISQSRNAIVIGGSNVLISGGSDQSHAILAKDSWINGNSDNSGLYATDTSYITSSNLSTIMGGFTNRIVNNSNGGILAGTQNILSSSTLTFYSVLAGGYDNRVYNSNGSSTFGGNHSRIYNNNYSTILGGYQNQISGTSIYTDYYNAILAGSQNKITGATDSVIIGGYQNNVYNDAIDSVIIGGRNNNINGHNYSVILGGSGNTIDFDFYTGENNSEAIISSYDCILTGTTRSGVMSSIGSIITASYDTTIIGGNNNKIYQFKNSAIIGGKNNSIGLIGQDSESVVILACDSYSAGAMTNTVVVPSLIITGLTSVSDLQTNASGQLVNGTSDAKLKKNIEQIPYGLEAIKQLRGVSFEYTPESNMGDGVRYGFIAQEVQNVLPTIVRPRVNDTDNLSLNYTEIIPVLVEAVKELASSSTTTNNTHLETQTVIAEDNNIELNFNGNPTTAIGGGLRVLHAKGQDIASELVTDDEGNFVTNNDFKPNALTIPFYTPSSSSDVNGNEGNMTRDDNYLYVKTSSGWKRSNLESF